MKIITWNINRASFTRKNLWEYLAGINFDIGFLQEVYVLPKEIKNKYNIVRGEMKTILAKKDIRLINRNDLLFPSKNDLIDDFYDLCQLEISGREIFLINVYNYFGPSIDDFKEFVIHLLDFVKRNKNKIIILGGDFNMDERFKGNLSNWSSVCKNFKKDLFMLGYKESFNELNNENAYTFIAPISKATYQLDYIFLPKEVIVRSVNIPHKNEIMDQKPRLSDHLPIIMDVEL